jgi:hypothetical protein
LAKLSRILEAHNYVIIKFAHDHCKIIFLFLIYRHENCFLFCQLADQDQSTRQIKTHIFGIITSIDLLDFIVKQSKGGEASTNEPIQQNGYHQETKTKLTVAKQSEALH